MDGSNPTTLVTRLGWPWGITIDFKTSKLLWTDFMTYKIESSNFQGHERRTVVQLTSTFLKGITVGNDRIYWAEQSAISSVHKLQSSTIDGKDVFALHSDTKRIYGLILVPDLSLPQTGQTTA